MKNLLLDLTFVVLIVGSTTFIIKRQLCFGAQCGSRCSGNNCAGSTGCNSAQCNTCVNNCASGCNSRPCQQNCVQQCQSSGSCRNEGCQGCSGNSCGSTQCNNCVSNCANSCNSRPCQQHCVQQCQSSRSCRSEDCDEECDSREETSNNSSKRNSTIGTSSTNDQKNDVEVITDIKITNKIDNHNRVSIPIKVDSANINNITVEEECCGQATGAKTSKRVITKEKNVDDKCCVVIPPRSCRYEEEDLHCDQNPYRTCSPKCESDVIAPHPVPIYPTRYSQERGSCPLSYFNSQYRPLCSNSQQARQFAGTSQEFLLDPYVHRSSNCKSINRPPWFACDNLKVENCGECFFCNGKYDPKTCFRSQGCPPQCQELLQNRNLQNDVGSIYGV